MKRLIAVLAVSMICACGDTDANGDGIVDGDPVTPDSVTAVAPSSPKGRVSGQVVDSQGKALEGVQVLLSGAEAATATTDANGLFMFDKVTGGSRVGLFYSKAGYAPAYANATVPGSTGNFPLNNGEVFVGPIGLIANEGSLTFHVVGYDGALVGAFRASLEVRPGFLDLSAADAAVGEFTVEASGADGVVTFAGVPSAHTLAQLESAPVLRAVALRTASYKLQIAPVVDGETVRYSGATYEISASELLAAPWIRTVVLDQPYSTESLNIVATNVRNLLEHPTFGRYNLVPSAGPLTVAFNQTVAPSAVAEIYVDRQDAADYSPVLANVEVSSVGGQLRVMPNQRLDNAFVEGHKYYVVLQATSRDNPGAGTVRVGAPFFGGSLGSPQPLGNVTVQFLDNAATAGWFNPGEKLQIVFERNIGRAEAAGFTVPLFFNYDLNRSGTTGDAVGELGNDEPYCIRDAETVPFTGAFKSGYSRWAQANTASNAVRAANTVTLPFDGIANAAGMSVTLAFSQSHKCSGVLQTLWGENLLTDVTTSLTSKAVPAN